MQQTCVCEAATTGADTTHNTPQSAPALHVAYSTRFGVGGGCQHQPSGNLEFAATPHDDLFWLAGKSCYNSGNCLQLVCKQHGMQLAASHLSQGIIGMSSTPQDVPHHLVVQQLGSSRCWAVGQQVSQRVAKQAAEKV
jgi:hypothetical protein